MITIREVLQSFEESLMTEMSSQGFPEWSINASGSNLKDLFAQLSSEDIQDLLGDINEGLQLKVTIDISDQLALELEEILRMRNIIRDEAEEEADEDQIP